MQVPGCIELLAEPIAIRSPAVDKLSQQHDVGAETPQYLPEAGRDWLGSDSMVDVPG